ncbi:hypothetical protein MRB53_041494 [Persea americana]|nr:hypothetical protein MRB53_041494 [Persea americana]
MSKVWLRVSAGVLARKPLLRFGARQVCRSDDPLLLHNQYRRSDRSTQRNWSISLMESQLSSSCNFTYCCDQDSPTGNTVRCERNATDATDAINATQCLVH